MLVRDGLSIIEATLRRYFPGAEIEVGKGKGTHGERQWGGSVTTASGAYAGKTWEPDALKAQGIDFESMVVEDVRRMVQDVTLAEAIKNNVNSRGEGEAL